MKDRVSRPISPNGSTDTNVTYMLLLRAVAFFPRSIFVRACVHVRYVLFHVCSAKSSSLFFCKLRGENLGIFYWISKTVRARIAVVDHLLRVVSLKDTKFSFGDIDFYFSID